MVEEDGYLIINGKSWEDWSVGQLLGLTVELAEARCGSWQLVQLATDIPARKEALAVYSADLKREVMAYRAIGILRMALDPTPRRVEVCRREVALSRVEDAEETARSAERQEFVLGCEMGGMCPDGWEVPDPDGVIPQDQS